MATPRKAAGKTAKVVKKATKRVSTTKNRRGDNIPVPARTKRDPRFTPVGELGHRAVVDLPPSGHSTSARTMRYAEIQKGIRDSVEPGKWVPVATYAGRGGASVVKRALEQGARPTDGEPGDWEYETRRTDEGGSVLWCRLKGATE